nr:hypothetical protein [Nonlabens ulvanivorans]
MGVFTLFNYFFKVALKKSNLRFFSLLLLVLVGFSQAAVAQCDITSVSTSMISACNDNGTTPDASDDFFTADVTILFQATPATGSLQIAGDNTVVQSVDVTTLPPGATSYTFPAVSFTADGTPISITASFIGDPSCTFSLAEPSAGLAPASCSPDCVISNIQTANASVCNNNGTPQDPSDDFFTTDIIVTFSNPPTTGTLNVTGDAVISEGVTALNGLPTSHTFTGIQMAADGSPIDLTASFSDNTCPLNVPAAGTAPASCSEDCSIDNIELVVGSNTICNDNGTIGDPSDDFFTYDVTVTYTNVPATGALALTTPSQTVNVPVGGVDSPYISYFCRTSKSCRWYCNRYYSCLYGRCSLYSTSAFSTNCSKSM